MLRVCVVGGGKAGVAAAFESATSGARVTILERASRLQGVPAQESDGRSARAHDQLERVLSAGVEVRLEEPALSVSASCTVRTPKVRTSYDAVVVTTGSRPAFKAFPGVRKSGVLVLDQMDDVEHARDKFAAARNVLVCGSGLVALRVADMISGEGRRVTLLAPGGGADDFLCPEVASLLREAAEEAGVSFVDSVADSALGLGAVEAVLAGGRVFPCDLLVVVPAKVPSAPAVEAATHPSGAVVVDSFLRSSRSGIFAAGECALLPPTGILGGAMLGSTTRASGKAAGANASGRTVSFSPVHAFEAEVFGLRLACVGPSQRGARREGFDAGTSQASSSDGLCSILFNRRDSGILGAQLVGKPGGQVLDYLSQAVSQRASLSSLAYQEHSDSTDISLVSEAAREGLLRGK